MTGCTCSAAVVALWLGTTSIVRASVASVNLLDPDLQPKFTTLVPNPLDPSFLFDTETSPNLQVAVGEGKAVTGLLHPTTNEPLETTVWGYGADDVYTWPGKTFQVRRDQTIRVTWHNKIPIDGGYLLTGKNNELDDFTGRSVIDQTVHWAYTGSSHTIEEDGTPIVPHLHGGHSDAYSDGNPEYYFTPNFGLKGPQWVHSTYTYTNDQAATCLWYHDHSMGITRLNVYAGMAGFYIIRDNRDTGMPDNPMQLPAFPYELPLVVQDRMFKDSGELFYPSFAGDPFYHGFIVEEGATIDEEWPSALAEMFGDFMTVNGKIWPKAEVEPRQYRLRLLNGCDSRFMVLQLFAVPALDQEDFTNATPVPFYVIGGDHGFSFTPTQVTSLVFEPAARYDIIVDFAPYENQRLILKNIGGDEPFGGDIPGPQIFEHTNKVMAFDVVKPLDVNVTDNWSPPPTSGDDVTEVQRSQEGPQPPPNHIDVSVNNRRRLGLFEGHDTQGRLMPLLGTIDPAVDINGDPICWPNDEKHQAAGLVGQMNGTATYHSPTTENIKYNDVEEWEIWNLSADAHPIHLHLVKFVLMGRKEIKLDSAANEYGEIEPEEMHLKKGDGTYYTEFPLPLADGSMGQGYFVENPTYGDDIDEATLIAQGYINNFHRDVITALPGQVTIIRAKFDKPGEFNWHCHILAHEDHDMMRRFHVGELPSYQQGGSCTPVEDPSGAVSAFASRSAMLMATLSVVLSLM